jgi:galactoside O-acetyltransferase
MAGPYYKLTSVVHAFEKISSPIKLQGMHCRPIMIKDDAWIDGHSTILPGVRISQGAIVGAGSVVTKDMQTLSIVAGVPAKVIRWRSTKHNPSISSTYNYEI